MSAPAASPAAPPPNHVLLRSVHLRAVEHAHAGAPLMERAGAAAAKVALQLMGASRAPTLILAGPGNNGGDSFVLARHLHQSGHAVVLVYNGDETRLPKDARHAYEQARASGLRFHAGIPELHYSLVVDGLLGIGLTRAVSGEMAALIERVNRFRGPVLALDVPSGLDADTGRVRGIAVRATHTATFMAAKPGLYTLDGPEHCGTVSVHRLGIEALPNDGALLDRGEFSEWLIPRKINTHKGSYGSLAVIGGAAGMCGAALLAARAALNLGAGRVYCGLLQAMQMDPMQPELMLRTPADALANATAIVAGPGLGTSESAADLLRRLTSADLPVLLDADALNLVAAHRVLGHALQRRPTPALLTPHPAEAARLLQSDSAAVQADRIASALALAQRFNAFVALKGCGTVLARPDGRWRINATGNPGLASGGSGDVLAGMAGALLAQGWAGWPALCAAVHLHGQAADDLVSCGQGPIGLTASELIPAARHRLNLWVAGD